MRNLVLAGIVVVLFDHLGCASTTHRAMAVDEHFASQMTVEGALQVVGKRLGADWSQEPVVRRNDDCGQSGLQPPQQLGQRIYYRDMTITYWGPDTNQFATQTFWYLEFRVGSRRCKAMQADLGDTAARELATAVSVLRKADSQDEVQYVLPAPPQVTQESTVGEIEAAFLSRQTPRIEETRLMDLYVRKIAENLSDEALAPVVSPPSPEVGFNVMLRTESKAKYEGRETTTIIEESRELSETAFGGFTWTTWNKSRSTDSISESTGEATESAFAFSPFAAESSLETDTRQADGSSSENALVTTVELRELSTEVFPLSLGKVLSGKVTLTQNSIGYVSGSWGSSNYSSVDKISSATKCIVADWSAVTVKGRSEPVVVVRCLSSSRTVPISGTYASRNVEVTNRSISEYHVSSLLGIPLRTNRKSVSVEVESYATSETQVTGYAF